MVNLYMTNEVAKQALCLFVLFLLLIVPAVRSLVRTIRAIRAERQNARCLRFGRRFCVPITSFGHKRVERHITDDPRKKLRFAQHTDVITIPSLFCYSKQEKRGCWSSPDEIRAMSKKNNFEIDLEYVLLDLQDRRLFYVEVKRKLEHKLSRRRKRQVHFGGVTEKLLIPLWSDYEPDEFLSQWYLPRDLEEFVEVNYRQVEEEGATEADVCVDESMDDVCVEESGALSTADVLFPGGSAGGGISRWMFWPPAKVSIARPCIWWSVVWETVVVPHFSREIT